MRCHKRVMFISACLLMATLALLTLTVYSDTREKETAKISFDDLLIKWERETEVGKFLVVKARLNSPELIAAHPRYSENSRNNMLNLVRKQTVIFLWLENTGASDIELSFSNMILANDLGEQFLPASFYALDARPIKKDFILPPGEEIGLSLHFPKLKEPLGRVKLSLTHCRYTFVTFAVSLEWDFGPLAVKFNELRQKKARLKILEKELGRLEAQLGKVSDEIVTLKKEIKESELKGFGN